MSDRSQPSLLKSASSFIGVILFILCLRWLTFEPFVIPSGSMLPNLLVFDHILVSKWDFGLRLPFTKKWVYGPAAPERGEIIVFRAVEEDIFMVKRVVGLPGDEIELTTEGQLIINGKKVERKRSPETEERLVHLKLQQEYRNYDIFLEDLSETPVEVLKASWNLSFPDQVYKVPEGHVFVLGDNRDNSRDSRYWGSLPMNHLIGKTRLVWLSCDKTLKSLPFVCDPTSLRWDRIMRSSP